jgi:hypothetical protein
MSQLSLIASIDSEGSTTLIASSARADVNTKLSFGLSSL